MRTERTRSILVEDFCWSYESIITSVRLKESRRFFERLNQVYRTEVLDFHAFTTPSDCRSAILPGPVRRSLVAAPERPQGSGHELQLLAVIRPDVADPADVGPAGQEPRPQPADAG